MIMVICPPPWGAMFFLLKREREREKSKVKALFTAQKKKKKKHILRHTSRTGKGFVLPVTCPQVTEELAKHLSEPDAAEEQEAH